MKCCNRLIAFFRHSSLSTTHYELQEKMISCNGKLTISTIISSLYRTMSFYAVARGHKVGIYDSWTTCESQVKGFQNARYKKFKTRLEAENFVKEFGGAAGTAFLQTQAPAQKTFVNKLDSIAFPKETTNLTTESKEFWPECDGDTFDQDDICDEDLLNALYEVEGLPDKPSSSNALKRSAAGDHSGNSKIPRHESNVLKVAGFIHKGEYRFPIDDEGFAIVYTDGSCINNGQANARAGFGVYFEKNHLLNTSQAVTGRVTNNVGEIQAAVHAIQIAREFGIDRLCVCTDSQFLINAVTCWMQAWKRKDWRLKNGEPVKNAVDFKLLDLLLEDKQIIVKWNYVKGHAGIEGNDMADMLARNGAAEYARLHLN